MINHSKMRTPRTNVQIGGKILLLMMTTETDVSGLFEEVLKTIIEF